MMVSGNWVPGLVSIAGGTPVLAQDGKHSPYVQWSDIQAQNPNLL